MPAQMGYKWAGMLGLHRAEVALKGQKGDESG